MSFRQNLINARSHIIFLVALACGLGLVISLEKNMPAEPTPTHSTARPGQPAEFSAPVARPAAMASFDAVTPLPLAHTGASRPEDLSHARIAWTYFENNTDPDTGLVNSADQYPSTTMWETGFLLHCGDFCGPAGIDRQ